MVIGLMLFLAQSHAAEIHDAVNNNEIERISVLLDADPQWLDLRNEDGMTPLNLASINGNLDAVTLLLQKDADITIGDMDNTRPIHCAAISGNIQIAELLLARGATVNDQDENGATPLVFAAGRRHLDMVRYLIEKGADVNITTSRGMTSIFFAGTPEIAAIILENGGDVNARANDGITPLHGAASRGRLELVRFLLERGADPNIRSAEGYTPLFLVNGENVLQIVELLIEHGAQVNITNNENGTPLHMIASNGSVAAAELLISKGADVNAVTEYGWTPLCMAAMRSAEITEFLLSRGANPNPHEIDKKDDCPCAGFETPLHFAIRSDSIQTVKVLVNGGALINVTDEDGVTPLHLAVSNCNGEIVNYLLENGAYVNLKETRHGRTELHTAAIKGQKDMVGQLLAAGADVGTRDNEGMTALDYARYHGFASIASLLEKHNAPSAKYAKLTPGVLNKTKIKDKQAVIWYLGHSGWAIRTENHLLIFDYYEFPNRAVPKDASLASGYIVPSEIKNENVAVFVSHEHGDHYDPRIFAWRNEITDINYILGCRPPDTAQAYIYTGPGTEQEIGDMRVCTIRSNDAGVGFLIEVDGLTILHPGDHANGSMDMSASYTTEIDALATMSNDIDLAFFAILGCSLGTPESVQLGVHYAIEHLKPKVLFPMHAGHAPYIYRDFVQEAAKKNYDTQLAYALNDGDRFLYQLGKITKIE